MFRRWYLWFGLALLFAAETARAQVGGTGWVPCPITFKVQWPTNAAMAERYWFTNDIYHFEVYSNDGAFTPGNRTKPRTEQRFTPDYTGGEVQYQAMEMAPSNENSYCIFQIHTGNSQTPGHGATTFMLFWFSSDGGSVRVYDRHELASGLGNKWFQLNVDHDVAHHLIRVWINRKLVWTQRDNGAGDFYFKDGVYVQNHNPSPKMDAYISGIRMWIRPVSRLVLGDAKSE
jgi:Alginate lyase